MKPTLVVTVLVAVFIVIYTVDSYEYAMHEGFLAFSTQDYEQAAAKFEQAKTSNPCDIQATVLQSVARYKADRSS